MESITEIVNMGLGRPTCPSCNGSGKDDQNRNCSLCNGQGILIYD